MPILEQTLAGKTIAITRPPGQADRVIERLSTLGANPITTPTIDIVPPFDFTQLDAAIANLSSYDWLLFTSVNGVRIFLERMSALGILPAALGDLKVGAIGPATARVLEECGSKVTFVPTTYQAESILAEIGVVTGQRLLLPRAELARPVLATGLRERGATVDELTAYRTVPGPGIDVLAALLQAERLDAIAFTSSSTIRFLFEGLLERLKSASEIQLLLALPAIVCIGPITAATAIELGLRVDVVAQSYTMDGLVTALAAYFSQPEASRH